MDTSKLIDKLKINKESSFNYKERRMSEWKENYTLYRDRVTTNRITQRQTVNFPFMKQTIRTLLKDVDDMPVLYFKNLDNDKQKELFLNEYWGETISLNCNRMELKDISDKKQVMLTGRSFDQMQIINGKVRISIIDVDDMLVDRHVDPTNIDTARFIIHSNIIKPLSELLESDEYDKKALKRLELFFTSKEGIIRNATNEQMLIKKQEKMREMGLEDVADPVLGEIYVDLCMHFHYDKKEGDDEQLYLTVEAEDMEIFLHKPLEEVIGKTKDNYWQTHFPYNSWADDIDVVDFWTDGVADILRTPNKILNAWISQLVENRTLKNLNMNIFNSSLENFIPQTWQPKAWGMYGIPVPEGGRISDVFQPLPVADLSESLDEIQYMVSMTEKATGATATLQGTQIEKQVTLGEVQLSLGEAKERVKGMSKFYTPVWKDRAQKFLKLIEAAPEKLDAVKIYKEGKNSNDMYEREIAPKDWKTKTGYSVEIWSQDEKDAQDTTLLEKQNAVMVNMPDNPKVQEIYKRKLVEWAGYTPDEINDVMAYEEEKMQQLNAQQNQVGQPMMQQDVMQEVPQEPAIDLQKQEEATNRLKALQQQVAQ